jgi:hypothetical protein
LYCRVINNIQPYSLYPYNGRLAPSVPPYGYVPCYAALVSLLLVSLSVLPFCPTVFSWRWASIVGPATVPLGPPLLTLPLGSCAL